MTTERVARPEAESVALAVEKYAGFLEEGWEDEGVRGAATLIRVLGRYYELMDTDIDRLRALLLEAIEDIESWAGYASEYFQDKHDLKGCVARYRDAVDMSATTTEK